MTIHEFLIREYRLRPFHALYLVPLSAAFLLLVAARDRAGDNSQPSYSDLASIRARRAARIALEKAYIIVPTPDLPPAP